MALDREHIWLNQRYLTHKDKEFTTNGGTLEISINSSTTDYNNFTTPVFNIGIFNDKIRYNLNLKYQDVFDLLISIENLMKNIQDIYNNGGSEIRKLYNKKNFKLEFKLSKKTGKKAVLIIVANSTSDFGAVIISFDLFLSVVELLKNFKENYILLPFEISNRSTLSCVLNELKEIKEFNKTLPTSIVDLNRVNTSISIPFDSDNNSPPWDTEIIDKQKEFDKYVKDNIDSVEIPGIEKINNQVQEEYDSLLFDVILKKDISNFDSLIMSLTTHQSPIIKFKEILSDYVSSSLPSIESNELKSALYYSKRFFLYNIQNCTKNGAKIPSSIPIIKYRPNEFSDENINLAYDLLTISMYIRLIRDKLETKIPDSSINKSLLYMAVRNYTDIFTFSFLDNIDQNIIIKCVMRRFQKYSNEGFFKSFDDLLNQYNLQSISENEMIHFTTQITNKVIGEDKTLNILDLHRKEYEDNKIKLPCDSDLSVDQIYELIIGEIELKLEMENTSTSFCDEVLELLGIEVKTEEEEIQKEENWIDNI